MYSCTFFGHRNTPSEIEHDLLAAIKNLITAHNVDTFYIGNHGNFDSIALRCLKKLKQIYNHITYYVVLAYMPKSIGNIYGCETILADNAETTHPKYAILNRNRWMIEKSDYVITYVTHSFGGAAKHMHFAEKAGKIVININRGRSI